ncbi:MAG TPA: hypothetical protein VFA90_05035 [Terriglobales bacterium]|nr:hypothetical protein [Terriglobales bacterium]
MKRTAIVLLVAAAVLALVGALAFAFTYEARSRATRYLGFVALLRINTPNDVVASELHQAGIPIRSLGDCKQDCIMTFHVDDWQLWRLHLAPPVGFNGRLDFRHGALVYKFTSMGQDIMVWSASVAEGTPPLSTEALQTSRLTGNQDSSGKLRHVIIDLVPSDFSEFRSKAYAFNVRCIGSLKPCEADEYLPTRELTRLSAERADSH